MLFNSFHFLLFFPIVTVIYFIFPKKVRYIWLLIASYYFYMSLNYQYAFFLLGSTLITYFSAFAIGKTEKKNIKRLFLILSIVINLAALGIFKYFNFAFENISMLMGLFGVTLAEPTFSLILPVGISFYTFQALGYNIDVYRGDKEPTKNFFKYALFVSFFPLILSGPIERSKNLLVQIEKGSTFNYDNFRSGLLQMLWGYIQKMIIVDRLAIIVNTAYGNYSGYTGFTLVMAAIFYSLQIYIDFAGYSNIAIGAARVLGFKINANFNAPYFALSISDFWRRWHISLSSWFRDYLYIPLGGNRKGKFRKYLNLLIVFLVSGLWHGAEWSFIIWGALHGIYQILGDLLMPVRNKIVEFFDIDREAFSHKLLKGISTFLLVTFAWIFFRAANISEAFNFISNIFSEFNPWVLTNGANFALGLDTADYRLLVFFLGLNLLISILKQKFDVLEKFREQGIWFRWLIYIAAVLSIMIFSVYGEGYATASFLYFQF